MPFVMPCNIIISNNYYYRLTDTFRAAHKPFVVGAPNVVPSSTNTSKMHENNWTIKYKWFGFVLIDTFMPPQQQQQRKFHYVIIFIQSIDFFQTHRFFFSDDSICTTSVSDLEFHRLYGINFCFCFCLDLLQQHSPIRMHSIKCSKLHFK